jgi:DNA recombination protein RmuC
MLPDTILWVFFTIFFLGLLTFQRWYFKNRLTDCRNFLEQERRKCLELKLHLEHQQELYEHKLKTVESSDIKLEERLRDISQTTLLNTQRSFMEIAEAIIEKSHLRSERSLEQQNHQMHQMTEPLKQHLQQLLGQIHSLEGSRIQAYESLHQQIQNLLTSHKDLQKETHNLSSSLRSPHIRGHWGEMQLRRVLEISGMMEHCDFVEQPTFYDDEQKSYRPDFVIKLPEDRTIIIDAKAPMEAYLEFANIITDPPLRHKKQLEYSKVIRQHITLLSDKRYWRNGNSNLDFVLMFLPGESMLSAALEVDPALIEFGTEKKVIPATPTTLIALLQTIALGWRHKKLQDHAETINILGRELEKHIYNFMGSFSILGKSLEQSTKRYNETLKNLEAHIQPTIEKLASMGLNKSEKLQDLKTIHLLPKESKENL